MATYRKILLIGVLAISLGICSLVTSYTYASVKNLAQIFISSSEEALIAMPEEIELKVKKDITIVRTLTDIEAVNDSHANTHRIASNSLLHTELNCMVHTETFTNTNLESSNFTITNNNNEAIIVSFDLVRGFNRLQNQPVSILDNIKRGITILPGQTEVISLVIDNSIEDQSIEIVISATWSDGSAKIIKKVNIYTDTVVNAKLVDLRKSKL